MTEIKPMLLTEMDFTADVWQKYATWLFQEKHNGIRAIAHFRNGKMVSLRNRRNQPVLNLFPEFQKINIGTDAILDGEVVVFDKSHKSVFYGGINQRDKKLYVDKVDSHHVCFVAFDCLYWGGKVVADKPYKERLALLTFADTPEIEVVKNIDKPEEYWNKVVVPENREGLVVKSPTAKYEVDTRSKNNLKLKNYKLVDVLISKLEANNRGQKVYGSATINGVVIEVECQFGGTHNINVGEVVPVEYLDVVGNRLIQPHKIKGMVID